MKLLPITVALLAAWAKPTAALGCKNLEPLPSISPVHSLQINSASLKAAANSAPASSDNNSWKAPTVPAVTPKQTNQKPLSTNAVVIDRVVLGVGITVAAVLLYNGIKHRNGPEGKKEEELEEIPPTPPVKEEVEEIPPTPPVKEEKEESTPPVKEEKEAEKLAEAKTTPPVEPSTSPKSSEEKEPAPSDTSKTATESALPAIADALKEVSSDSAGSKNLPAIAEVKQVVDAIMQSLQGLSKTLENSREDNLAEAKTTPPVKEEKEESTQPVKEEEKLADDKTTQPVKEEKEEDNLADDKTTQPVKEEKEESTQPVKEEKEEDNLADAKTTPPVEPSTSSTPEDSKSSEEKKPAPSDTSKTEQVQPPLPKPEEEQKAAPSDAAKPAKGSSLGREELEWQAREVAPLLQAFSEIKEDELAAAKSEEQETSSKPEDALWKALYATEEALYATEEALKQFKLNLGGRQNSYVQVKTALCATDEALISTAIRTLLDKTVRTAITNFQQPENSNSHSWTAAYNSAQFVDERFKKLAEAVPSYLQTLQACLRLEDSQGSSGASLVAETKEALNELLSALKNLREANQSAIEQQISEDLIKELAVKQSNNFTAVESEKQAKPTQPVKSPSSPQPEANTLDTSTAAQSQPPLPKPEGEQQAAPSGTSTAAQGQSGETESRYYSEAQALNQITEQALLVSRREDAKFKRGKERRKAKSNSAGSRLSKEISSTVLQVSSQELLPKLVMAAKTLDLTAPLQSFKKKRPDNIKAIEEKLERIYNPNAVVGSAEEEEALSTEELEVLGCIARVMFQDANQETTKAARAAMDAIPSQYDSLIKELAVKQDNDFTEVESNSLCSLKACKAKLAWERESTVKSYHDNERATCLLQELQADGTSAGQKLKEALRQRGAFNRRKAQAIYKQVADLKRKAIASFNEACRQPKADNGPAFRESYNVANQKLVSDLMRLEVEKEKLVLELVQETAGYCDNLTFRQTDIEHIYQSTTSLEGQTRL